VQRHWNIWQRENEYDLVITDVGMPEMSGWQLAEKIKSEGYTTKMAVLTGWGSEISQEDKDRYNVAYVLGKPVALKDLKALINDVLGGKAD
jgi:YesN/AraC family two-component response regulator